MLVPTSFEDNPVSLAIYFDLKKFDPGFIWFFR
jgi:hypothetical protein